MTAALIVGCGVLGFVVGLFLNVLIDRVPERQPLLPLRFRCRNCPGASSGDENAGDEEPDEVDLGTTIGGEPDDAAGDDQGQPHPTDDGSHDYPEHPDHPGLPLGRWLRPGSPCPVCAKPLSARYLLVALATAGLFAGVAARFEGDWVLPAFLVLMASLVTVSVIDLHLHIIPNRIVYPTVFVSVPLLLVAAAAGSDWDDLKTAAIGAAAAWGMLLVIHLLVPAGMGFGDVRLAFVLGLFLGWLSLGHVMAGVFLGFLLGAVLGVVLVVLRIRKRTDHIPFGPFLALGAALAVFWGEQLIDWWVG